MNHPKLRRWALGAAIYFFPFFSFCECVCVCVCVWFCLYSFAFTICPKVLSVLFFFSIVFSTCYHWLICFLVWLLSSFFITLKKFLIIFILITYFILLYVIFFFLSFLFFLPLFWATWMTGSCCSSQASRLRLWGGRAKLRTLVHKRPPSST